MKPLKGGMVVAIEPTFVSALLERFYGGASGEPVRTAHEFTAGEELMLDRLVTRVVRVAADHWNEVVPLETSLAEGMNVERDLFHATFALEDRSEGMAAFIEKRKPVNKNR